MPCRDTINFIHVKGQGLEQQQEDFKMEVSIKDLLDAGAHFGHQKRRWNPKMKRYVFEIRNGLYIIDLAKTLEQLRKATKIVRQAVEDRRSILIVGTKKQAKAVVRECAEQCGEFYVCERWLGGMLTNMQTIRRSIKTLERIEKKLSGEESDLTKKERSLLGKEQVKLEKNLSGIRTMRRMPGLIIVIDPGHEHIAVAEATKLKIPIMALADTNCNPDPIEHVIPCNDDALKSVKIVLQTLTQAIIDKKNDLNLSLQIATDGEQEASKAALAEAIAEKGA